MTSLTEENYLKTIYSLNHAKASKASTNAIASRLDTKASSVTDMLKRLSEKKLVDYKKYKAAKLTEDGKKIAISIIRKHRLWEYFLVQKLKFGWDEVHDIAEQLEHIQSPKLTNQLDAFLNFPKFDPHGDPIPNKDGEFPHRHNLLLASANKNDTCVITGVLDHSTEFLHYLKQVQIELGTTLKVIHINSFDQSIQVENDSKESFTLSDKVTQNLYINIK